MTLAGASGGGKEPPHDRAYYPAMVLVAMGAFAAVLLFVSIEGRKN
ncbi:hypothetical protein [Sphingobium sp. C100]|nr:hypothetical protein [Sphingobium sp. C100]